MKEFVLTGAGEIPLKIDYRAELNDEQLAVVTAAEGPQLVLAGAGSGKTRVVTYRVAWLLEHGVHPDQILLLTFTNKAAKEMIARVEGLLGMYPTGLWSGTFHSIANRILRMYGDHTEYGRNFSILDEEDAYDLIKLCVKEVKTDTFGRKFPSASVLKSIASYAHNARISLAASLERRASTFEPLLPEIERVLVRYQQEKVRQKAMDFDDLLLEWYRLLQNDESVRQSLARRFRFIMVDEFQDTNVVQADIVKLLASEQGSILAVGDDAQSIYSFRAAEIKNILEFPKTYDGAMVHHLVTNYRSTPEILHVANAVIAHNTNQFEKNLVSVMKEGEKPLIVPASDERQEAQYIAEQILELLRDGARLKQIAVLFRAAFHSQTLEFELMRRAIPYDYRGGMKFFERAHIKDAIAHLRVLRNVKDEVAWLRLLQLHPGMGLATAAKASAHAGQFDTVADVLASAPKVSPKAMIGWHRAAKIVAEMSAESLPSHMLRVFAGSDEYREYLDAEYQNARERKEDLEQFALFAEQYTELGPFLDAVTLTGDFGALMDTEREETKTPEEDRIVLSTIHQAKGLEWDNVFILHLAEGSFPSERSFQNEKEIEEERRLFYVAVTRAKKKLFLTYPLTMGYEHVMLRQPSMFIDEIPHDAIEQVRLRQTHPQWISQGSSYHQKPNKKPSTFLSDDYPDDSFDEPTIVLDGNGEEVAAKKKKAPSSFLIDI